MMLGGLNVIYMKKCMCVVCYVLVKNAELFRRGVKKDFSLTYKLKSLSATLFLQSMKLLRRLDISCSM